jgi:hypothetical protein
MRKGFFLKNFKNKNRIITSLCLVFCVILGLSCRGTALSIGEAMLILVKGLRWKGRYFVPIQRENCRN